MPNRELRRPTRRMRVEELRTDVTRQQLEIERELDDWVNPPGIDPRRMRKVKPGNARCACGNYEWPDNPGQRILIREAQIHIPYEPHVVECNTLIHPFLAGLLH